MRTFSMFDRTTSTKFIAPRRQERNEKYLLISPNLACFASFARVMVFPIPQSKFQICSARFSSHFGARWVWPGSLRPLSHGPENSFRGIDDRGDVNGAEN